MKRLENDHPQIIFNGIPVKKVNDHKYQGIMTRSYLSSPILSYLSLKQEKALVY